MIKIDNIQQYIGFETDYPKRSGLLGLLWIMLIVCIPVAFLGVYSIITKIVILPLMLAMIIWIVYLLDKTETKSVQYILFLGIFSVFMSVSFLVAAYKIASLTAEISVTYLVLIMAAYIFANLINIFITYRLIKKGYYNVKRKIKNPIGVIFAASIIGLATGKLFLNSGISQHLSARVMIICLVFLGLCFSFGTHNFLKYYFVKNYQSIK